MKKNFFKLSISFVLLLGIALSALFSGCEALTFLGLSDCGTCSARGRKFEADDFEGFKRACLELDDYTVRIYGTDHGEEYDILYKVTPECIYVKQFTEKVGYYNVQRNETDYYVVKNGESPYTIRRVGPDGRYIKETYPYEFTYEIEEIIEILSMDWRYDEGEEKFDIYEDGENLDAYLKINRRKISLFFEGKELFRFYDFGATKVEIPKV